MKDLTDQKWINKIKTGTRDLQKKFIALLECSTT